MQVEKQAMPTLSDDLLSELTEHARRVRIKIIKMLAKAGSGHPGGRFDGGDDAVLDGNRKAGAQSVAVKHRAGADPAHHSTSNR